MADEEPETTTLQYLIGFIVILVIIGAGMLAFWIYLSVVCSGLPAQGPPKAPPPTMPPGWTGRGDL